MTDLDQFVSEGEREHVSVAPPARGPNVALAWTPAGTYTITVDGAPAVTLHGGIFHEDARGIAEGLIGAMRGYLAGRGR